MVVFRPQRTRCPLGQVGHHSAQPCGWPSQASHLHPAHPFLLIPAFCPPVRMTSCDWMILAPWSTWGTKLFCAWPGSVSQLPCSGERMSPSPLMAPEWSCFLRLQSTLGVAIPASSHMSYKQPSLPSLSVTIQHCLGWEQRES